MQKSFRDKQKLKQYESPNRNRSGTIEDKHRNMNVTYLQRFPFFKRRLILCNGIHEEIHVEHITKMGKLY